MLYNSPDGEALRPGLLLQVHEHLLLQLILPVADADAVVVPVQPVYQRLRQSANTGLDVLTICRLPARPVSSMTNVPHAATQGDRVRCFARDWSMPPTTATGHGGTQPTNETHMMACWSWVKQG